MAKRSPNKKQTLIKLEPIEPVIRVIRGQRMILDFDLARIYETDTRSLVQAVKRNLERFPSDFMLQLSKADYEPLRSQIVISKGRGGRRISHMPSPNTARLWLRMY